MPKLLSKQAILDELRAPRDVDPFYAELTRFSEEHDLALPTVNLQDAELRELRDLVKRWSKGEPVAGVIETDFGFDDFGESRS